LRPASLLHNAERWLPSDRDPLTGTGLRQTFKIPKAFGSYDAVISDPTVDAVL